MIIGIACSRGIGIGTVIRIPECELTFENKPVTDPEREKKRFQDAIMKFKERTTALAEDVKKRIGPKEALIIQGQMDIISDPVMSCEIVKMIVGGQCAENAINTVYDMYYHMFASMNDELMRQRASDIADIKTSLLKILLGIKDPDIRHVPPGTILVASDLTPSMTSQITRENVVGIITETGGSASHSAILARAMEIPAVLNVPDALNLVQDKDTAIVDGTEGIVYINPGKDILSFHLMRQKESAKKQAALKKFFGKPTLTADGTRLNLFCNIGTAKDARKALECDGEGIGLFRTEFLFMDAAQLPSEQEQFEAYKEAALAMKGKCVIIRTLDIGGDKDIPYLNMKKEANPFLGYRGVRYCLGNPEAYKIQLRAIMRASAFGKVKIMVPLVTCVDELTRVKTLIAEIAKELKGSGIDFDHDLEVGCMIETPAASLTADLLAKEADFFSIGTNDLTQYTMSVDRGNPDVAYLYSAFQPSVLRSIRHIITCGKNAGIPVGMCGEAAADPLMIPLLLSFGLSEYSVNPALVLTVRSTISRWSLTEADAITAKVMAMDTEAEIVKALKAVAKED